MLFTSHEWAVELTQPRPPTEVAPQPPSRAMREAEHAARELQVAEAVAICADPGFWAGLERALKLLAPLREVMLVVRSERPLLGQVWPLWMSVRELCMKVRGGWWWWWGWSRQWQGRGMSILLCASVAV
jgi:hypothetical protein